MEVFYADGATFLIVANSLLLESNFGITSIADPVVKSVVYMFVGGVTFERRGGDFETRGVDDVHTFAVEGVDGETYTILAAANDDSVDLYVWKAVAGGQQVGQFYLKSRISNIAEPTSITSLVIDGTTYIVLATRGGDELLVYSYLPAVFEVSKASHK